MSKATNKTMSELELLKDEIIERRTELILGNVLRYSVMLAALIVIVGAIMLLVKGDSFSKDYSVFIQGPHDLRSVGGVIHLAFTGSPLGVIQLGLLALILTPILRVALSIIAFAMERDVLYVMLTLFVLTLLLLSLLYF